MGKNIKVSIIIPAFNSEKWITNCLKSIPVRDDIEVICINDGSTDKTIGYLRNFEKFSKQNAKIIDYKENKGVSYARNKGIEASKGEYIVCIDSDDYIYPDIFNKIVDNYLNSEYDMVFYNMENNVKYVFKSEQNNYQCKYGNFKFIKKSFLGDLRYTVGKQYAEDKELHLKLMEKYPYCYFTHEVMYHYNYPRKGSLSAIGENR